MNCIYNIFAKVFIIGICLENHTIFLVNEISQSFLTMDYSVTHRGEHIFLEFGIFNFSKMGYYHRSPFTCATDVCTLKNWSVLGYCELLQC